MNDVFSTPEADLHDPIAAGEYGSIEKAIEGRYHFKIREALSEAWNNLKGYKRKIWLGLLIYMAVIFVAQLATSFLFASSPVLLILSQQLIQLLIGMPLFAGLYIMSIKRSVDVPVEVGDVFSCFNKTLKIVGTSIFMYVLIFIGFLLLVLPGIYLMVAYMMAIPLVAEKDIGIWEALELSRKAITKRWFKFFFFLMVIGFILMVAALPLLIGLIWAIPLASLAFAIVYRNMFGVEPATMNQ